MTQENKTRAFDKNCNQAESQWDDFFDFIEQNPEELSKFELELELELERDKSLPEDKELFE